MATTTGAAATDAIETAPDLSKFGSVSEVVAPWSCVGSTTTASETTLGMNRGGTVWHRIWVPKPGVVTVNDYPTAYLPPGETITAGDTLLYMYRGPNDGSPLTDATLVSGYTSTWANDDSAGGGKGLISVTEATGGVWYYICHTPYNGNPLANQWTYVTFPADPSLHAQAGGVGDSQAAMFGGIIPLEAQAAGSSIISALLSKVLNFGITVPPGPARAYSVYAGRSTVNPPVNRGSGYTVSYGSGGGGATGPSAPDAPKVGQVWPRGVMPSGSPSGS